MPGACCGMNNTPQQQRVGDSMSSSANIARAPITDAAAEAPEKSMLKVALTALGGTSIEWYDFFLYGTAAALVFPTIFFAQDMPELVRLLASFSTFAVGFFARPVG